MIEVAKKNDFFLVKGKILTEKKTFNVSQLNVLFDGLIKNLYRFFKIKQINNFSFNINKKLKFKDINHRVKNKTSFFG